MLPDADVRSALRQTPLFAHLDEEAISALAPIVQQREYAHGDTAFSPRDSAQAIHIIAQGQGRLYRLALGTRPATFRHYRAVSLCSLSPFLSQEAPSGYFDVTSKRATLLAIPASVVHALRRAHPSVEEGLVSVLADWLAFGFMRVEELSLTGLSQRLAAIVTRLARSNELRLVAETHQELADLAGGSRSETTRLLGKFRGRELIVRNPHGRGFIVPDPEKLASTYR